LSTAIATNSPESAGGVVTRPQIHSIGAVAEQHRAIAEIQAALTVAAARPRDEVGAVERITNACQRIGLAEKSEYVYDRGGTEITGPTIDLLTVIANCWGNIQFGFREMSQRNGESEVEAFAWDLETNAKRSVTFTVPHKRVTKRGTTILTDPRDIYELVANQAQRRVRACLEAVVPPDVVEDAVNQCRATLKTTAQVTPESIAGLVDAFGKLGVQKAQIEERLGRKLEAMQPAQLVSMRRIYKSITDGMSKPDEWFHGKQEADKETGSATASVKDKLKAKAEPPKVQAPAEQFAACETSAAVKALRERLGAAAATDSEAADIDVLATEAEVRIKAAKKQGELVK
jgi:hypothetical protein